MRILVASHEWDAQIPGGAQRSAAALARALADVGNDVTLASVTSPQDSREVRFLDREFPGLTQTLVPSATDLESFSWSDPSYADRWTEVIQQANPDVVHLHHYYKVGMELPSLSKTLNPATAVVLTLHEYLAICLMSGQMVDGAGHLCLRSSVSRCSKCVSWPQSRIAQRRDFVWLGLQPVDHFITPSRFARSRYVDWGLDPERITVIPNATDTVGLTEIRSLPRPRQPGLRLTYLGQHTPYKGLDVLMQAVAIVEQMAPECITSIQVYGAGAEAFGRDFVELLERLHQPVSHKVHFQGSYTHQHLGAILSHSDGLVMPSTWWENSPVVIEEALAAGVPVLCSNVGGMAEKVRPGIDGLHFEVGNPASLAESIIQFADRPRTVREMRIPVPPQAVAEVHLDLYQQVLSGKSMQG